MYDARTRLASGVADEVREHFGDQVLADRDPSLGAGVRGAVLRPDRADLRSRLPGALSYLEAAREIATKGAPTMTQEKAAPAGSAAVSDR